ncbi:MAG: hypothetical protein A2070_08450 [Bdellovibrionales bacterium GWC1_52_8]|nr:MAG: hypothetical protein A2Z97_04865 [Bdellovibrionales bacterium GWB1_52_6]OFZ05582.1 MAG: hypothetical protein A2X97_11990 [Bdellovibrionales bacterium GWA1_52_35]OFZ42930.1 MAG: hypothetical protein A2070_08450 [Bdellovibrionales bacterium GWC1_52_8]
MNQKIKYRESFRPFAPAVLAEAASECFDLKHPNPYMLFTAPVQNQRRLELSDEQRRLKGMKLPHVPRSDLPAITHVLS